MGCGTGNTLFPILEGTKKSRPNLFLWGCDFSKKAIEIVKQDSRYDPNRSFAFVHDISSLSQDIINDSENTLQPHSLDYIFLIFVFSALHASTFLSTINKLKVLLKPNTGKIFFRDYGLYDLAQLRLKPYHWISGSQYKRGDGTLMYFFTLKELETLFQEQAGLKILQLKEDKRLIVNRKRQLRMFRVWIQGQFSIS